MGFLVVVVVVAIFLMAPGKSTNVEIRLMTMEKPSSTDVGRLGLVDFTNNSKITLSQLVILNFPTEDHCHAK